MKKSFFILASGTFLSGLVTLASCSTPSEKIDNAEQAVIDADKALGEANQEYLADMEKYRIETAQKLASNDKSVVEFNARIAKEKKEVQADYNKKIAELNKKNSDMKKKIADYKAEGKDKWETFKNEFNHDMDELGQAFKDLMIKNVE